MQQKGLVTSTTERIITLQSSEVGAVEEFLQALLTVRVESVPRWSYLLLPQGKILYEMLLFPVGKAWWLYSPYECQGLQEKLLFYRLRRPLEIGVREVGLHRFWGLEEGMALRELNVGGGMIALFGDPRCERLCFWGVGEGERGGWGYRQETLEAFQRWQTRVGIPALGQDFDSGKVFALEAGGVVWRAVDIDKGCYLGQEVVTRMQVRNLQKRGFISVRWKGVIPAPGQEEIVQRTPDEQPLCIGHLRSYWQEKDSGGGLAWVDLRAMRKDSLFFLKKHSIMLEVER